MNCAASIHLKYASSVILERMRIKKISRKVGISSATHLADVDTDGATRVICELAAGKPSCRIGFLEQIPVFVGVGGLSRDIKRQHLRWIITNSCTICRG